MQITFLIDRFGSEPGGVQKVVTELAERLGDIHDVAIVIPASTPRRAPVEAADKGDARAILLHRPGRRARILSAPADLVSLPFLRRYGYGRAGIPAAQFYGSIHGRSLAAALPRRPDVVHAFTADMVGHLAIGLGRAVNAPVVCTGFPHPGQYGDGPIDSWAYQRADQVVALTGHDRDIYLGLGVLGDRITVIPPPSDDLGIDGREGSRERLGINGALVVFAGARRSYKGADILHAAAPAIGARIEGATVAFVGPGDAMRPTAGVEIRDEGLVASSTMADWIRAADIVVLPSLHEICPIVVLEAWSAGVPVVVSDIPALKHLVEVSGGGIAVPRHPDAVASAVVDLLVDADQRRNLGQSGRRYWQSCCAIGAILTTHEGMYERLLSVQQAGSSDSRHR